MTVIRNFFGRDADCRSGRRLRPGMTSEGESLSMTIKEGRLEYDGIEERGQG